MKNLVACAVLLSILGAVALARADSPGVTRVRYTKGPLLVAPGGAVLVIPDPPGPRPLAVASDAAVGRRGEKDGEFTAVTIARPSQLTAWVRTADLAIVTSAPVTLAPSARLVGRPRAADASGVTLDEGLAIRVLGTTRTAAHIAYENPGVRVDGWVPLTAIGKVYQEMPRVTVFGTPTEAAKLPARADLLAAPGGARLATVKSVGEDDAVALVVSFGDVVKKHVRVEWYLRGVTVVGWLPESRLVATPGNVIGGVIGGELGEPLRGGAVAQGTDVVDHPGGTLLGRYDEDTRVEILEVQKGYRRVNLSTDVGKVTLWLAPATAPR